MRHVFDNREDAGRRLAEALRSRSLRQPLVLAIPRGGIEIGHALAQGIGAELDVVLARKIRAAHQQELAIGAVSENGSVVLDEWADRSPGCDAAYIERERSNQLEEIGRNRELYRSVRAQAPVGGRSVIVTDDGIATGSTMLAALRSARSGGPHELIVAVPVGAPERLDEIRRHCDELVCLDASPRFVAVGQAYRDFGEVSDERALSLLGSNPASP